MVSARGAALREGPAKRGLGPAVAASRRHVAPAGPEAPGGGQGLARLLRSATPPAPTRLTAPQRCSPARCRQALPAPLQPRARGCGN